MGRLDRLGGLDLEYDPFLDDEIGAQLSDDGTTELYGDDALSIDRESLGPERHAHGSFVRRLGKAESGLMVDLVKTWSMRLVRSRWSIGGAGWNG